MGRTRKAEKLAHSAVTGMQASFELTAFLAHFIVDHHEKTPPTTDAQSVKGDKMCCFCGSRRVDDEETGATMVHESDCPVPVAWEVKGLADELTLYESSEAAKKNVAAIKNLLDTAGEEKTDAES